MRNNLALGISLLLLAELFFASMWACIKFSGINIPFFQMVFFRAIISVLIIGILMGIKNVSFKIHNKRILLARCFSGYLGMTMTFYALTKIELGNVATLHHTSPIFVALLSPFLIKEHSNRRLLFWIVVAFIGVVLIVKPDEGIFHNAALFAFLSGFFAAIAYISVRHLHLTDHYMVITFYFALFAALTSLPFMLNNYVAPQPLEFAALISAGILGTAAQLLLTYSYKCAAANILAPFNNSAVIFSFILGWLFWKELPDIFSIFGAFLIIIAVAFITHLANRGIRSERPPRIGEED